MSKEPTKAQKLLQGLKEMFSAAEKAEKFADYKLADGTMISCDKLEVGGAATIGGTPAPAGTYTMEDGATMTVDASGLITAYTPKVAAAVAAPDMTTPEGMRAAYDKFATGTPEERVANLEILCKAMMEYCFGWQLREAQAKQNTDAAIAVYKNLTNTTGAQVVAQSKMMKEVFALLTEVVGLPAGDLPGTQKNKNSFSKVEAKNKSLEKFQAAAAKLNKEWKELEKVA